MAGKDEGDRAKPNRLSNLKKKKKKKLDKLSRHRAAL